MDACPECEVRLIDQGYRRECPECGTVWKRQTETVGWSPIASKGDGGGG